MCLGRRVAELELHLLLARIVQEFEIRYAPVHEIVEPFVRGVTIPEKPAEKPGSSLLTDVNDLYSMGSSVSK